MRTVNVVIEDADHDKKPDDVTWRDVILAGLKAVRETVVINGTKNEQ